LIIPLPITDKILKMASVRNHSRNNKKLQLTYAYVEKIKVQFTKQIRARSINLAGKKEKKFDF